MDSLFNFYNQPPVPQQQQSIPVNFMDAIQSAAMQAKQLLNQGNDPRSIAAVAFPYMPRELMNTNDPNQIIEYLHQNSIRLNTLQQMAIQKFFGR